MSWPATDWKVARKRETTWRARAQSLHVTASGTQPGDKRRKEGQEYARTARYNYKEAMSKRGRTRREKERGDGGEAEEEEEDDEQRTSGKRWPVIRHRPARRDGVEGLRRLGLANGAPKTCTRRADTRLARALVGASSDCCVLARARRARAIGCPSSLSVCHARCLTVPVARERKQNRRARSAIRNARSIHQSFHTLRSSPKLPYCTRLLL